MSARIAPTSRTDVTLLGDHRLHPMSGDTRDPQTPEDDPDKPPASGPSPSVTSPAFMPPPEAATPALPSSSEAAFNASVAVSALPTTPPLPTKIYQQDNDTWSPPESDLHLTNRLA